MTTFHLVQSFLHWEQPAENRLALAGKIADCRGGVVVLPEMFSTGFSMASARLAETMEQETVAWMKAQSEKLDSIICGSVIIKENNNYYNRFVWVDGDSTTTYDKRHLFRMADEHQFYSPGVKRTVLEHQSLRILPQVCYDLRFPAFSRNRGDYDLLLYVANWPAARREQWLTLLKARAIENQAYVIGVNRVGKDGNDVNYAGDSCLVNFRGEIIEDLAGEDAVVSVSIDALALSQYRETFPAYLDADTFTLDLNSSD